MGMGRSSLPAAAAAGLGPSTRLLSTLVVERCSSWPQELWMERSASHALVIHQELLCTSPGLRLIQMPGTDCAYPLAHTHEQGQPWRSE